MSVRPARQGGHPVGQADDTLLIQLRGPDLSAYMGVRGAPPRAGTTVRLWHLRGTWHVSSEGPAVGTWWVRPIDDAAIRLGDLLTDRPSRGAPVVQRVWKGWLAVASKEIRPAALGGAR